MLSRVTLLVVLFLVIVTSMPASAEEKAQRDGWQFGANVYIWMANMGGKTASGDSFEMTFDDLLKDLDFLYMGDF
jgi:hypothetical protein